MYTLNLSHIPITRTSSNNSCSTVQSLPLSSPVSHPFTTTSCQYTCSTHPPCQHTFSTHLFITPCQHTFLTHLFNTPYQHTFSTHLFNAPEHHKTESGGDNLAADFSRELADFTVYVIDLRSYIIDLRSS